VHTCPQCVLELRGLIFSLMPTAVGCDDDDKSCEFTVTLRMTALLGNLGVGNQPARGWQFQLFWFKIFGESTGYGCYHLQLYQYSCTSTDCGNRKYSVTVTVTVTLSQSQSQCTVTVTVTVTVTNTVIHHYNSLQSSGTNSTGSDVLVLCGKSPVF
jgi:hypothetical protein